MFGTLSFTNKGPSKNFKGGSFSHGGSGHPTRKSACKTCRVQKVKCSGDQSGCARCVGLKVKCVYDKAGKPISRLSRPRDSSRTCPPAGMELSWSIHSPTKDDSPKRRDNELSPVPQKGSDTVFQVAYPVDKPQNEPSPPSICPEWLTSMSTGEELAAPQSHTPCSSSYNGDGTTMDLIDETLGDSDYLLDWEFENDKSRNDLTGIAYESTHASSCLAPLGSVAQQDASLARPSQAPEAPDNRSSSSLIPCACSSHLSTLLFSLSGYSRRYSRSPSRSSPCGDGMELGQSMPFVLAAHKRAARLEDDLMDCGSQCFAQGSNTVQLIMLIEQLVDLYAGLVKQLPAVSCAGDEQMAATVEIVIPVLVGGYVVESVAERRGLIALLVGERLKAIIGFSVRFRERLRSVLGQAGQCRERLYAAIQRLELVRDEYCAGKRDLEPQGWRHFVKRSSGAGVDKD